MDESARRTAMEKLVPGLEPSEYGKMPELFHSNSQKVTRPTMETVVEEIKPDGETTSPVKLIRKPILPRNDFDGVDSDDETDEEAFGDNDDSEDERPQVVGEIELDMEEEEEEFLEFSRQTLGISDEQWGEIIRDRRGRGGKYQHLAQDVTISYAWFKSFRSNQCYG